VAALGDNRVVRDVERFGHRSRFEHDPLRDTVRTRLTEMMVSERWYRMRAEAAYALWCAPRAFGSVDAAAETLAAVLDRYRSSALVVNRGPFVGPCLILPLMPERPEMLALKAAAIRPGPVLEQAALRLVPLMHTTGAETAVRRAADVDTVRR
jgi:hypothetical protein